jgi:hypothetical protein
VSPKEEVMPRLSLCIAVAVASLVAAPVALADGGPLLVTQGGTGVASQAHPDLHFVTVSDGAAGTLLETVDVASGGIFGWVRLPGSWGIPTVGNGSPLGQGLSHDGRTLVLGSVGVAYASPSRFLVVDARRMEAVRTIVLDGTFSFDAVSPNGSRLYLIQYAAAGDLTHYIVRAYDLRRGRLLPGKIAERSEDEKTMVGTPVTRTTSAGGRWVYTLYQKPSGEAFIHALDTVGAVAYCIDLPKNHELYSIVLALGDHDRTLALDSRDGGPWLRVAVGSWRISYPGGGFPWAWAGGGLGGGAVLLLAGALLLRRRRGEKVEQHAGQELGLA